MNITKTILTFFFISFFLIGSAETPSKIIIKNTSLRTGKSSKSKIILRLKKGNKLVFIGDCSKYYCKVKFKKKIGWVKKHLLEDILIENNKLPKTINIPINSNSDKKIKQPIEENNPSLSPKHKPVKETTHSNDFDYVSLPIFAFIIISVLTIILRLLYYFFSGEYKQQNTRQFELLNDAFISGNKKQARKKIQEKKRKEEQQKRNTALRKKSELERTEQKRINDRKRKVEESQKRIAEQHRQRELEKIKKKLLEEKEQKERENRRKNIERQRIEDIEKIEQKIIEEKKQKAEKHRIWKAAQLRLKEIERTEQQKQKKLEEAKQKRIKDRKREEEEYERKIAESRNQKLKDEKKQKKLKAIKLDISKYSFEEKNTTYSIEILKIYNSTLSNFGYYEIRKNALQFWHTLSSDERDKIYTQLNRGIAILQTSEQLKYYHVSYGKKHKVKLDFAFNKLNFIPDYEDIEIIDYGCGQALATIMFIDYLKIKGNLNFTIQKVILIEPSKSALQRGALNTIYSLKSISNKTKQTIFCVNKKLSEISTSDLVTNKKSLKIHFLSNVLDIDDFNIDELADRIKKSQGGKNIFICVSPNFYTDGTHWRNQRLKKFLANFNIEPIVHDYSNKGYIIVFSINFSNFESAYLNKKPSINSFEDKY